MAGEQQLGHVGVGPPRHLHPAFDRGDDCRRATVAEHLAVQPARGLHRRPRLLGRDREHLAELFARAVFHPFQHALRRLAAAQKIDLGQEQEPVVLDHVGHVVPDDLLFRQIGRSAPDDDVGALAGPGRRAALLGLHRAGRHFQKGNHLQRGDVHLQRDHRRGQLQDLRQIAAGHGFDPAIGQRAQHPRHRSVLHGDRGQAQGFGDDDHPGQQVQDRGFARPRQAQKRHARLPVKPFDQTLSRFGRAACRQQTPVQKAAKPLRDCQFCVRFRHGLLYDDHAPWPQAHR